MAPNLGDRTHFIVGGEYQDTKSIGICSQVRSWCRDGAALFTNSRLLPTNGQPHYIIGPNGNYPNQSRTGVLTPCVAFVGVCIQGPLPQYIFDATGTTTSIFDPGKYADGAGVFGFGQGSSATDVGPYDATTLKPAVKRYTTLAHVDFTISDSLTSFLEASYARSEAVNPVANGAIGPIALQVGPGVFVPLSSRIMPDNAYLPANLAPGGADALPAGGAVLGYNMNGIAPARNETNNNTVRVTGGLNGMLSGSWSWDAYFEYGAEQERPASVPQRRGHVPAAGPGCGG